jgi:hypothetical protein
MAKQDQVLISEFTYNCVASRVEAVQVGSRQFKGKQKEVMVYEVFSTHEEGEGNLLQAAEGEEVVLTLTKYIISPEEEEGYEDEEQQMD